MIKWSVVNLIVWGFYGLCYENGLKNKNGRKFMVCVSSDEISRSYVGIWSLRKRVCKCFGVKF